jgi:hypothetical protein
MDLLERITRCPFGGQCPFGPRSQGEADEHYARELHALASIPSMSCAHADADDRAPEALQAVFRALRPDSMAYGDGERLRLFSEWLLELRELYRDVRSPGKRPWPAFMHAMMSGTPAPPDCDALFAATGVHMVGADDDGVVCAGEYLAGRPLDTPVLLPDGSASTLLRSLPTLEPVSPALRGARLAAACRRTACRTRVVGAAGNYRRMTRDELVSEVARRSTEIEHARLKAGAEEAPAV